MTRGSAPAQHFLAHPISLLPAFLLFLFLSASSAHAQGCSACRDTTAGSAPQARAGLRRGILILGLPAGAVFLGIILVARKIESERTSLSAPVATSITDV